LAAVVAATFPGPFVLPPYSELYHANGDRKDASDNAWLPRYVEKEDQPFILAEEEDLGLGLLQV